MVNKINFIYNKNDNFHIFIYVAAGSIYESDKNRGISHLLEHMVLKHTKKYNEIQLLKNITTLGGTYNAVTDKDTTFYYIMTNNDNYKEASDILYSVLSEPLFLQHELDIEKKIVLEEIVRRYDNGSQLNDLAYLTILAKDNKYAYPIEGYIKILNSITIADLTDYYKKHYADYLVNVNCDIKNKNVVEKYILHKFGPNKIINFKNIGMLYGSLSFNNLVFVIKRNYKQYTTNLIFPSFPRSMIKENIILTFMQYFLSSSGLYSILMYQLRSKRGLIYNISSMNETYRYLGIFRFVISTSDKNTYQIINIVLDILYKLSLNGLIKKVLDYYKKGFLNNQKYAFTNTEFVTALKGESLFYDSDIKYDDYIKTIKEITNDDIKEISRKIFDFSKMGILTYGNYHNIKSTNSKIIDLVSTYTNIINKKFYSM
jgi:predicted Zn-dependent peptidase